MAELTKIYLTKYALSAGIEEKLAEITPDGYAKPHGETWAFHNRRHWHLNRAEALTAAERMRLAKIASLKKQIAKLEKLQFTKGK